MVRSKHFQNQRSNRRAISRRRIFNLSAIESKKSKSISLESLLQEQQNESRFLFDQLIRHLFEEFIFQILDQHLWWNCCQVLDDWRANRPESRERPEASLKANTIGGRVIKRDITQTLIKIMVICILGNNCTIRLAAIERTIPWQWSESNNTFALALGLLIFLIFVAVLSHCFKIGSTIGFTRVFHWALDWRLVPSLRSRQ